MPIEKVIPAKENVSIAASTTGPADIASSSNEYANRFAGVAGEYFLDVQTRAVASAIYAEKAYTTVLEVGGGHCQLTKFFLDQDLKVTIQASTEQSLQRAKELGFERKVHFSVSPLTPLAFADNSFDLVSGIRLMAHVPDWKLFLKEMLRVSKRGIVFDFANINTLNILTPLLFKIKKKIESNTRPYACQSMSEVDSYLRSLGCKDLVTVPQFVCPMGIHRLLKSKLASENIEASFHALGLNNKFGSPVIVFAQK